MFTNKPLAACFAFILIFILIAIPNFIPKLELAALISGYLMLILASAHNGLYMIRMLKTKQTGFFILSFFVFGLLGFMFLFHSIPQNGFMCNKAQISTFEYPEYNKTLYVYDYQCVPDGHSEIYIKNDFFPTIKQIGHSNMSFYGKSFKYNTSQTNNLLHFKGVSFFGQNIEAYNLETGKLIFR